jgi:hypothetical protein
VERRISHVQLMRDRVREALLGDACLHDRGHRSDESHRLCVAGDDRAEELDEAVRQDVMNRVEPPVATAAPAAVRFRRGA